jgi:tetratricopeptide (TPR) repeat protein
MPSSNIWKITGIALLLAILAACSNAPQKPNSESAGMSSGTDPVQDNFERAVAKLKDGSDEDALSLFNELANSHPNLAAPSVNIGLIEIKRGNLDAAEIALLRASTLKPELPVIYNELGIVYRRLGRFGESEAAYLKALQLAPDYADAHLNLGILCDIYLGNLSAALEHYERYQALTNATNDAVAKWIIDIRQRLNKNTGPSS